MIQLINETFADGGDDAVNMRKKTIGISKNLWSMFRIAFYTGLVISFSQVGASLIDGIVTAKFFGAPEMAAAGLVYPYFSIAGVISGCISVGMQTMCTKEIGRGKIENTNKIFSEAVILGGALSFLLTVIFIVFSSPIAGIFGARAAAEDLRSLTVEYLIGLAFGTPAVILSAIIAPAIQLDNGSTAIQTGAIACTIFDIVFDIIAAMSGWGLFGIGVATSLSNYANLLVLLLHFRRKDKIIHFIPTKLLKDDIKEMFDLGFEMVIRRAVNIIRPIILNTLIISLGGSIAMSVMSIRNSFNSFVEIPGTAIAGAVGLMTGIFYGEINEDDIKNTATIAHRYDTIYSILAFIIVCAFAKPIAVFYLGAESDGLDLLTFSIYCIALRTFFDILCFSRLSYLQSVYKVRLSLVFSVIVNLVAIVIAAFVLGKMFGAYGIMAAFPVSDLLVLITVYAYYAITKKCFFPKSDDYIGLDDSFHIGPGDVIDLPIKDISEATLTSMQIMLFCKGHKLDGRKAYYASLCVEEMVMNIIEHGFKENNNSGTVDIRAVIRNGEIVIRIRDNCPQFNILNQAKLVAENDDPLANPGIKLIQKSAKNISYYRTLKTNNTIITV